MFWFVLLTWLPVGLLAELVFLGTLKASEDELPEWIAAVVKRYEALSQWKMILCGWGSALAFLVWVAVNDDWKNIRLGWPPKEASWFGNLFK